MFMHNRFLGAVTPNREPFSFTIGSKLFYSAVITKYILYQLTTQFLQGLLQKWFSLNVFIRFCSPTSEITEASANGDTYIPEMS